MYENCISPSRNLGYILDKKDWLVERPRLRLCTWRNQLGNLKVAWEPTIDHSWLRPGFSPEFSDALLTDCFHGRNELMWIKQPRLFSVKDERVGHAATLLCLALLRGYEQLVERLRVHFELEQAGALIMKTDQKGFASSIEAVKEPQVS